MSSEYGWPDEAIWDLPLARLRQITATIQQRRYLQTRQENMRTSWLARSLATFIAGGYMVEKKGQNPAFDFAQQLSYDAIEAVALGAEVPEPAKTDGAGKVLDIDPQESIARALERNTAGSYERFMRMDTSLTQRGKMI